MTVFCSTIIPTIGRSSLEKSVESILCQELAGESFEVIVVNDSGSPLPPAEWQQSAHVQLIQTHRRERSVARNTGAAVARGRYLHFLDDDDWLEPGALSRLRDLAHHSNAAWLYGSSQTLDRQGRPLVQLHHRLHGNCFLQVMAGEWIPLQASLIKTEAFFALGGFNAMLCGPEDIDLLRRVALHYDLAGTETIVANIVLGESGSTTDYARHPAQSRWAREQILDEPNVYARLRDSIQQPPRGDISAWHGRIARIYLTSMLWNLQRGRLWSALSRGRYGLSGMGQAGRHLFTRPFWRALSHAYASDTFARGSAAAQTQQRIPE